MMGRAGWPGGLVGAAALLAALSASPPAGVGPGAAAGPAPAFAVASGLLSTSGSASSAARTRFQASTRPPVTPAARPVAAQAQDTQVQDTVFRHDQHRTLDCLSCHTVDPVHGEVRVRTLSDCRSCHHREPLARDCANCHQRSEVPQATLQIPRALDLSVGRAPERLLPFRHEVHASVTCQSCHTEGLALSAAAVSCANCHQEHHRPEARCASCHLPVLETPPHPVEVHVGCAGAGCHQEIPFEGVPRTRALCVACHQDMEDHKPGPACTNCHLLPRPRPPGEQVRSEVGSLMQRKEER